MHARTKKEFEEWLKVFGLVSKMNKVGYSVADKNPYLFEDQQSMMNTKNSMSLLNKSQNMLQQLGDTQGIENFMNKSNEMVEFGIGNMMLNE